MKKVILFTLLFVATLTQAQTTVPATAISDAVAAAEELSVPTVLLKTDAQGNPISNEKAYFFSKEESSSRNSTSVSLGAPYVFGMRWTFKASKIVELGAEGGFGFSTGYAGPLVNLVPLSFAGIENVYGGYRLYGLIPVAFSNDFEHGRTHAVVAGFRHRILYGEVGRGFQKKTIDGLAETSKPWMISFGVVLLR